MIIWGRESLHHTHATVASTTCSVALLSAQKDSACRAPQRQQHINERKEDLFLLLHPPPRFVELGQTSIGGSSPLTDTHIADASSSSVGTLEYIKGLPCSSASSLRIINTITGQNLLWEKVIKEQTTVCTSLAQRPRCSARFRVFTP